MTKSECCFCLTSVARNVARTPPPVNNVPDSPTGHGEEKGFLQTTNTRWRQVTRCVGHEIALLPEYAGKINTCSHVTECAEKLNTCSHFTECAEKPEDASRTSPSARRTGSNKFRTSQSTRMDQTKGSALVEVRKRHGFALLRVRGHKLVLGRVYQAVTVRYTKIGAQHHRE